MVSGADHGICHVQPWFLLFGSGYSAQPIEKEGGCCKIRMQILISMSLAEIKLWDINICGSVLGPSEVSMYSESNQGCLVSVLCIHLTEDFNILFT